MPRRLKAPRPRRLLSIEAAEELLDEAKEQHAQAIQHANDAIMFRAEAAWRAHEAGLGWKRIAARLDVSKPTAMSLAKRYAEAVSEGRRLGIGPQAKE